MAPAHASLWYGPWYLRANVPRQNVSLSIVANSDQGALRTLAYVIL